MKATRIAGYTLIATTSFFALLSWVFPFLWQYKYKDKSQTILCGNFLCICSGSDCEKHMYDKKKLEDWKEVDQDVYNGLCVNIFWTLLGLLSMGIAVLMLWKNKPKLYYPIIIAGCSFFLGIITFIGLFLRSDTHNFLKYNKDDDVLTWTFSASTAFAIISFILIIPTLYFSVNGINTH
ncbi:hypothetical protein M0811_11764 [Anaeramoeba ignava]|uniref:Uncharacterized protein n=1 Tax=Anaeramoeba ignava TaxID=1746090 RepID=A0A9Q0R6R8_ANAIG|nr:hypothetical protein M0811_11764 [Anaeramoeba ignava]